MNRKRARKQHGWQNDNQISADFHTGKGLSSGACKEYFLKLSEEVGELSRAMRKGLKAQNSNEFKGTIDEELLDVIYYALAIANTYDVDIEQVIRVKSAMNESDILQASNSKKADKGNFIPAGTKSASA